MKVDSAIVKEVYTTAARFKSRSKLKESASSSSAKVLFGGSLKASLVQADD